MHENQDPFLAVPPDGDAPFFCFAVLLVKDGDGQRIHKELRGTLEADPVLAQVLRGLDGVPLESLAQLYPSSGSTRVALPVVVRRHSGGTRTF